MHYVYFMQGQRDNVKIGVSKNPESRLKELQTGHSCKLKILESFPFASRLEAYDVEKRLHHRYRRHRLNGEWFKFGMYQEYKAMRAKDPGAFLWLKR